MPIKAHDTPASATAEKGEVMIDGPDGFALSFTPDAASKSATAMAAAAEKAQDQSDTDDPPEQA